MPSAILERMVDFGNNWAQNPPEPCRDAPIILTTDGMRVVIERHHRRAVQIVPVSPSPHIKAVHKTPVQVPEGMQPAPRESD